MLRKAAFVHDALKDFTTLAILHDDPQNTAILVGLKDLADVWVVQLLHQTDLLLEGCLFLLARGDYLFDRNLPALHLFVFSDKDLAKTPDTELMGIDAVSLGDLRVDANGDEGPGVEQTPHVPRCGLPSNPLVLMHLLDLLRLRFKATAGACGGTGHVVERVLHALADRDALSGPRDDACLQVRNPLVPRVEGRSGGKGMLRDLVPLSSLKPK
mmetsp:Transcript_131046/g.326936  ORF Transcript_131046/g.326936 Transcript_131046/m.326936 type:complete len:213 (+) Transcript_131046:1772-2410(+)